MYVIIPDVAVSILLPLIYSHAKAHRGECIAPFIPLQSIVD
jgi:hypothetical protein